MVEEGDVPRRLRQRQLFLEPGDLIGVEVVRIEHEESDRCCADDRDPALFIERVVPVPAHVEERVVPLLPEIVITERGVELHACLEERLVGFFETHSVGLGRSVAVIVVAEKQDEVERELSETRNHLLCKLALFVAPAAHVAEHRKANG